MDSGCFSTIQDCSFLVLMIMKIRLLPLFFILIIHQSYAQNISITFNVDMSYQIEKGNFDPQNEFVDIAGNFNGWGGTLNQLSDSDGDDIWTATVTGFQAGQSVEFKFRFNGQWDDREEFPGAGNNRTHTVGSENETLDFWYNDEEPPTGPAIAGISASSTFAFVNGSIIFSEDAGGLVESYGWVFEGGSPSSSQDPVVEVTYDQPGTYDVRLTVSNSFSSDEIILEDFITIGEQGTSDLKWWNEAVFYEIFVRSFYDSDGDGIGDFQGIIEKLDYLNDGDPSTDSDLGITGIWLMPIHDSPSYHGYDVNDYRSINPDYGTLEDFREFVEEAHNRGIKVIIDLVLNHSSTQIEWFQNARSSRDSEKRNWYRWSEIEPSVSGPWGQTVWHGSSTGYYYGLFWGGMPDLNYEEPEVVAEMNDVTRFWLEDVGIDGYRLDAVKFIKEDGNRLEDIDATHAFWREWVTEVKDANADAVTVGEAWTSTEKIVPYVVNNGLDFCFEFDLASAILYSVRSGDAASVESQVNKIINSYPYYQFGTFTTNHDMNRLMDELSEDEDKVKLASAIYLTLPGIPFIYYGEEVGMLGSKPDENIRRPMAWSNAAYAGFTNVNPWNLPPSNYRSNNVETQRAQEGSLFNWYRKLVQLRGSSAALQTGDYKRIDTGNASVYAYERVADDERVITLVNLSGSSKQVTLDVLALDKTADEPYFINQLGDERIDILGRDEVTINIEGETAMVLTSGELPLGLPFTDLEIFPNPVDDLLFVTSKESIEFQIIGIDGKLYMEGTTSDDPIPMQSLTPGTYILKLKSDKLNLDKKLIVE